MKRGGFNGGILLQGVPAANAHRSNASVALIASNATSANSTEKQSWLWKVRRVTLRQATVLDGETGSKLPAHYLDIYECESDDALGTNSSNSSSGAGGEEEKESYQLLKISSLEPSSVEEWIGSSRYGYSGDGFGFDVFGSKGDVAILVADSDESRSQWVGYIRDAVSYLADLESISSKLNLAIVSDASTANGQFSPSPIGANLRNNTDNNNDYYYDNKIDSDSTKNRAPSSNASIDMDDTRVANYTSPVSIAATGLIATTAQKYTGAIGEGEARSELSERSETMSETRSESGGVETVDQKLFVTRQQRNDLLQRMGSAGGSNNKHKNSSSSSNGNDVGGGISSKGSRVNNNNSNKAGGANELNISEIPMAPRSGSSLGSSPEGTISSKSSISQGDNGYGDDVLPSTSLNYLAAGVGGGSSGNSNSNSSHFERPPISKGPTNSNKSGDFNESRRGGASHSSNRPAIPSPGDQDTLAMGSNDATRSSHRYANTSDSIHNYSSQNFNSSPNDSNGDKKDINNYNISSGGHNNIITGGRDLHSQRGNGEGDFPDHFSSSQYDQHSHQGNRKPSPLHQTVGSSGLMQHHIGGVASLDASLGIGTGVEADPLYIQNITAGLVAQIANLNQQLEAERAESQIAREYQVNLQKELELRAKEYESNVQSLWEKERKLIQNSRFEIESRIMKASHDNNGYHDSALKLIKDQHSRELGCLRDELASERKRYAQLVHEEIRLRDRAEASELKIKLELDDLKSKRSTVSSDLSKAKDELKIMASRWDMERTELVKEYESKLLTMSLQLESAASNHHSELRVKTAELAKKFEYQMKEVERSITQSTFQQMQTDKMNEISIIQKRCNASIESVRSDEKKLAFAEVERVKEMFLDRERQTVHDLAALEKVHSTRISRLEMHVSDWQHKYDEAEMRFDQLRHDGEKQANELRFQIDTYRKKFDDQVKNSEVVHNKLVSTMREIEEHKIKENGYRAKLSEVIEENRVQRMELLETRRQATDGNAQVYQWKRIVKEKDLHQVANETALYIAKEEVTMLEHELHRLQEENERLTAHLGKSDKLIYGRPITANKVKSSRPSSASSTVIGSGGIGSSGGGNSYVSSTEHPPNRSSSPQISSSLRKAATHTQPVTRNNVPPQGAPLVTRFSSEAIKDFSRQDKSPLEGKPHIESHVFAATFSTAPRGL